MNLFLILFSMLFSGNASTLDIKGVVFDDAKKMADYHIILNGKEAHLIYNFSSNLKITYYYQRKKQFDLVYAGRYIELVKQGEKIRTSKSELKRILNKLSPTEKLVIRSNLINSSIGPKAVHEYSPEYAAASIWSKASEVNDAFWAWWEGEEEQVPVTSYVSALMGPYMKMIVLAEQIFIVAILPGRFVEMNLPLTVGKLKYAASCQCAYPLVSELCG